MYRKTYIEINTENLKHNVDTLVRNYPDYKYYFGVVKGNAYGHGYEIIKYLISSGINYLALSSLEEGIKARMEDSEIPILCLQPIDIENINVAIQNKITITISSYEYFKRLINLDLKDKIKVHLKINSGMNRLGISDNNQVLEIINNLKQNTNIELEGIFSHFATNGIYDKNWDKQLENFRKITSNIDLKEIPIVHLGRSSTLLSHKKIDFTNGIRIGMAMYDQYHISKKQGGIREILREIKRVYNTKMLNMSNTIVNTQYDFKTTFNLYSEIIEINKVKKGEYVGYGTSFETREDCYIGIIPIGYSDGLFRRNKNSFVSIKNKKYKIISVDMCMSTILIDDKVELYDKVELIGENISIFEVAQHNKTTTYEIMCSFKESIPRILK